MQPIKKTLPLFALAALLVLMAPAAASATHASGSSSRAQKYLFYYGSSLPSSYHQAVNLGFAQWDVSGQCHDFRQGGQIGVFRQFYDGALGTLAYVPADHGTMIIDSSENWYTGTGGPSLSQFDLWSTATHEAGHTLALTHTSGADTMAPSQSNGDTSLRSLTSNDINRIRTLYPFGTCTM